MTLSKHSHVVFSTLSGITSLAIGGTDKRLIIQRLLEGSILALQAERVYLLELEDDRLIRYSKARSDPPDQAIQVEVMSETPGVRHWLIREGREGHTCRKGGELAFDVPLLAESWLGSGDTNRVIISSPLVTERTIFGLLVAIHSVEGGSYAPDDEQVIAALANQAAIALENRLLYQKLERDAVTDGLTGVFNYRFLINSLGTEIKRAQRFKQFFSFVMMDVDNLKGYNDQRGHLAGSQALKEIAVILRRVCREIDVVCKYGGDEFGIILPRTDLEGAAVVTRRVLRAVADHEFDGETDRLLTCSAGVSCFPHDGQTAREIIANADRALYRAKGSGKNAVFTTDQFVEELQE